MIFNPRTKSELEAFLLFRKILTDYRLTRVDFLVIGGIIEWDLGFERKKQRRNILSTRFRQKGMSFAQIKKVVHASHKSIDAALTHLMELKLLDLGLDRLYYLNLEQYEPTKAEYYGSREFLYRRKPENAKNLDKEETVKSEQYEEECILEILNFPTRLKGLDLDGEHEYMRIAAELDFRKSQDEFNRSRSRSL